MIELAISIVAVLVLLFGFVVFFGSPFVRTLSSDRKRVFDELYSLGSDDLLVDLGSGDGVILREASRRGARAFGIELNPVLVLVSRFLSKNDKNIQIALGNLRTVPFPDDTTAVYVFGNTMHAKVISRVIRSEADRIGRDVYVLSYGASIPGLMVVKKKGAYTLYRTALRAVVLTV
jgi:predicted RNA methylase